MPAPSSLLVVPGRAAGRHGLSARSIEPRASQREAKGAWRDGPPRGATKVPEHEGPRPAAKPFVFKLVPEVGLEPTRF